MISDNFYKVGEITNLLRKPQKQSNNNRSNFQYERRVPATQPNWIKNTKRTQNLYTHWLFNKPPPSHLELTLVQH